MNLLYQIGSVISAFSAILLPLLKDADLTMATTKNYFALVLALFAVPESYSISSLYHNFLKRVTHKSLNTFYRTLNILAAKLPVLEAVQLQLLLKLIPAACQNLPLFLALDDTVQAKFGKKFQDVKVLFDHSAHDGNGYVNAHDFVALGLLLPLALADNGQAIYTFFPLKTHTYRPNGDSKYLQAAKMIELTMDGITTDQQVILLCDSWFPKAEINQTIINYPNLEMIANVRKDTVMYDFPSKSIGRGRPRKYGERIQLEDIELKYETEIGELGCINCLTRLFGTTPVHIIRSRVKESERLFLSTIEPQVLTGQTATSEAITQTMDYYKLRWQIETYFYNMKTFWHLGEYEVRSVDKINAYHHLVNTAYNLTKILPLTEPNLANLGLQSSRRVRGLLGQRIRAEIFLDSFAQKAQTHKKHFTLKVALRLLNSCTQIL